MKKEKRMLYVLGQVDDAFIAEAAPARKARRTQSPIKWGAIAACAACAAVAVLALLHTLRNTAMPMEPNDPSTPSALQQPDHGAAASLRAGQLHLVQLDYAANRPASDFVVYINRSLFVSQEQDGVYVIQPIHPVGDGLPACSLKIWRAAETSPAAAIASLAGELTASFAHVTDVSTSAADNRLYLHADNGAAGDGAALDIYAVDDLLGGTYLLAAGYDRQISEDDRMRLRDMIDSFTVISTADALHTPAYLASLRSAVDMLIPAVFANQMQAAGSILAQGALMDTYDRDVTAELAILSIDYAIDDGLAPATAVVSVKHRLGTEDSLCYLTIELSYIGGEWLVHFAGIEK